MIGQPGGHGRGSCPPPPSAPFTRRVRTGQQKLSLKSLNRVAATCTSHAFENSYRFRPFRLHRPRSVLFRAVLRVPTPSAMCSRTAATVSGGRRVSNSRVPFRSGKRA